MITVVHKSEVGQVYEYLSQRTISTMPLVQKCLPFLLTKTLVFTYWFVLSLALEVTNSKLEESVNLKYSTGLPSSDIVAQFALPVSTTTNLGFRTSLAGINTNRTKFDTSASPSSSSTKTYFTHLAVDERRNVLFAGATNKILQLNDNLRVLAKAETGPKRDSPLCHEGGCPSDVDTTLSNNHNKILVITYALEDGGLIACGSLRQGACEVYSLSRFPISPRFIPVPVAANDENASSYAFVGPSRYNWKEENILYVGTTFTNLGEYRHDVPAISSRRLSDLSYAEFSIQQSILSIDVKYRDNFVVDYVYGFNSSEFAYFALIQKKSHLVEEAGYVTRLARICISDKNYDSYTEVTIQCHDEFARKDYNILRDAKITTAGQKLAQKMGIKKGDHVFVGVFSPSKDVLRLSENESAICVYTLKDIEETFTENIHMCFNGTVKDRNLGYISGPINDGHCPIAGSLGNVYSFCTVGLKISGVAPITATAVMRLKNTSITAVTVTTSGPHSIAFLGTETGVIRKILISGERPVEYDTIVVDENNAILPDTTISSDKEFLYVLSKQKITKLRIEHCSLYTNCSACLESLDPFCGWCSLEKRCTVRSTCQKDTSASRWLSLGNGQECIDFESIIPDEMPIEMVSQVKLIIRTLPEPVNAKYRCIFGNSTPIDSEITENGLSCITPPIEERPKIPLGIDHVSVPLAVRSSETNKDFVSRSFSFFNCSSHSSCQKCVLSKWRCQWCLYENKCTHFLNGCHSDEKPIQSKSACPQLKNIGTPLMLPIHYPKELRFEVENLPKPKSTHMGFMCEIQIEAAQMLLPARVELGRFVVCEETPYSYEMNSHEYAANVVITWNRQHYIDSATIILYKCNFLGSHRGHADCSLCVTRDPKYQCTWCDNSCVYNETCITHANNNNSFRSTTCPTPRIDIIKPLSGPIEGGTLVTIEGSNLGIHEDDVRGKITIGKFTCELVNYEISVKIECRTSPVPHELSASLRVANNAGYTESSVQFHYRNIELLTLYPTVGPKSGGTQISLMGKYLNIGSEIRAYLDEYECHINYTQASSSQLTCITSEATQPEPIRSLRLKIDGANRTLLCKDNKNQNIMVTSFFPYHVERPSQPCSIYNYTQDPRIMQIKPLRSFSSGGRILTVHGMNLDSVQKPEMGVFFGRENVNKSTCLVINSNQMECPSPAVNIKFNMLSTAIVQNQLIDGVHKNNALFKDDGNHKNLNPFNSNVINASDRFYRIETFEDNYVKHEIRDVQLNLQLNFVMDNVEMVRDLGKYFPEVSSAIVYVADPKYYPFPNDGIKLYKGDALVIEGENLNLASDEYDVEVTIGKSQCNVTSLAIAQLACIPPQIQPSATDDNGVDQAEDLPLVVVKVGQNLRYIIGHLKYGFSNEYTFARTTLGISIIIFIVLSTLAIALIIYRRKSTQAEREYKRIQIQMIALESNVRSECKQAFAELQTDMTDLTADLENTGIPTLDHVNFIMKVFFPGVSDHPILYSQKSRPENAHSNYDVAMMKFDQLVSNKYFLLTLIETLEQQNSFNIRDRVNVASLLMVILMSKMEYATDILKCLLSRLIYKYVNSRHPQLMFRRTDNVVEKMLTNYMAICMYGYLKDYAGPSLFLLFKAIKHQVEKGLVDAVTHHARYSLSEDRLLREKVEHLPVILHIVQDDLDEKIQCRVLELDTISQVKYKILDAIFKNTPFSMRPSITEVDLEWRHDRGGNIVLQDEDLTTKTVNGWKEMNTLRHYGITEFAVMSLIARRDGSYNEHYQKHISTYHNLYFPRAEHMHTISHDEIDFGLHLPKAYHLIKPSLPNHCMSSNKTNLNSNAHFIAGSKTIPEVYLTRLLATKGTIQKFVDDFFATILTVNEVLSPAIKWLFDLIDDAARQHQVMDPDVIHAWKSNSLPLRFWVNFIKNPDFIFDVHKTESVDSCLNVIAQTFMDACSTNEYRIGKDSPSNKLLFAKDIPHYQKMVVQFYKEIAQLPQISDREMSTAMHHFSAQLCEEFDRVSALKELYIYVSKYSDQIFSAINADVNCRQMHIAHKLNDVSCTLENEDISNC